MIHSFFHSKSIHYQIRRFYSAKVTNCVTKEGTLKYYFFRGTKIFSKAANLPKYSFFNGIKGIFRCLNVKKILNEIYPKNVTLEMVDFSAQYSDKDTG